MLKKYILEKHKLAFPSTFGTKSSVHSQMQKSDPLEEHRSNDSESTPCGHQSNKENDSSNQHANNQCTAAPKTQPLTAQPKKVYTNVTKRIDNTVVYESHNV